jgi:hypothetical protein
VVGPIVCGLVSWLMIRPFRSPRPSRFGSSAGWIVALVVVGVALVATSRLLDADLSPYCSSGPLSVFGEHCGAVTRGIVLLLPLAVGVLLGVFARTSERSRRVGKR